MEELQRNIIQEELVKEWPKALNSDITSVIDSVIYHFVQMNSVVPAVQTLVTFKDKWTQGKFVWPCVVQPPADLHTTAAQNEGTATSDLKQSITLQSPIRNQHIMYHTNCFSFLFSSVFTWHSVVSITSNDIC